MGETGWKKNGSRLVALSLICAAGCYFPAPPRPGFQFAAPASVPQARVQISITPAESVGPVHSALVLIATVTDECGRPAAGEQVNWILESAGVGEIVEVDTGSGFARRGTKIDNQFATSYSGRQRRQIEFAAPGPNGDICVGPGQTWCIVTSTLEGETGVIAVAPAARQWEEGRAVAKRNWIDAEWDLPESASATVGHDYQLRARLRRISTGEPLQGYRLRFRVLDGIPASFTPGGGTEFESSTDENGLAEATVTQDEPQAGDSRVSVEVIRPTTGRALGTRVGGAVVTIRWVEPESLITIDGPELAAVGEELQYRVDISNNQTAPLNEVIASVALPAGMEFVRSDPPAEDQAGRLAWALDPLDVGAQRQIQFTLRAISDGDFSCCVDLVADGGVQEQSCQLTSIQRGQLQAEMDGPPQASVGETVEYRIRIHNRSNVSVFGIRVEDHFSAGLEHPEYGSDPLELPEFDLGPGQSSQVYIIELRATQAGEVTNTLTVKAAGDLETSAEVATQVGN